LTIGVPAWTAYFGWCVYHASGKGTKSNGFLPDRCKKCEMQIPRSRRHGASSVGVANEQSNQPSSSSGIPHLYFGLYIVIVLFSITSRYRLCSEHLRFCRVERKSTLGEISKLGGMLDQRTLVVLKFSSSREAGKICGYWCLAGATDSRVL
jgi:hypothetical protein